MNKSLLSFFLLITTLSIAQNFPAKNVELLLNKMVIPKVIEQESMRKYAYKNFYTVFDIENKHLETFKKSHRAFPKSSSISDYNELVGKEFVVFAIHERNKSYSSESELNYVLELFNENLGTIFYDYSSKYEHSFELEVIGGLDVPEGFYCNDIKTTSDKFTGDETKTTDFSEGICFMKVTKGNVSNIYLKINETGSTLNLGKKGLTLLLENNKRLERPETKIDVKLSGKNYVYSAFIELSNEEVNLLIENPITDDRLYIYDGEIKNGNKLSEYLKCLTR